MTAWRDLGPYHEAWYHALITEEDRSTEPDWSRVPEERREEVRARWSPKLVVTRCLLWGPQIGHFRRRYALVEVGPVAEIPLQTHRRFLTDHTRARDD